MIILLNYRLLLYQSEDGMDENPQQVLSECLEKFSTPDYIMEPGIFLQLKRYIFVITSTEEKRIFLTEFNYRYFQAGGNPETVIDLLSDNYKAVAQMTNLIADWLIMAGMSYYVYQTIGHSWRSL